tara:strand:+ start:889 stop:1584 length:696 start_codon:yes stop_codon:yes gene_type:complete
MKLNLRKYIGYLIVSLPIFLFTYVYLSNSKEYFSLTSLFSKKPDETNTKNKILPNKIPNNNIYSTQFVSQKKGPRHNNINDNLAAIKKPKGNLEPVGQSLFGNIQCRLLSECNDTYKFTGAEFQGVQCQNDSTTKVAKAIASIKNGYIEDILIIDPGFGYKESPKINVLGGNGTDAYAIALLDIDNKDKTKRSGIKKIEIKNAGRNYNSTPTISIEAPRTNHKCKLCCKIN